MKIVVMVAAIAALGAMAGCRSSAPAKAYANPVEACEQMADAAKRKECMEDIVADVSAAAKREKEMKKRRPQ